MKIAISATGSSLDAEVDPRFGRCQYFIIVDPDTMEFEAMDNSSAMAAGGAGISAAQMIASKGVQAVLTGNLGPNAHQVLSASGVDMISGVSGKVRDVVLAYKSGEFQSSSQPSVDAHFGMGMGRGMGTTGPAPTPESPEQELEMLKAQSKVLAQQLSEIQRRIGELEKRG